MIGDINWSVMLEGGGSITGTTSFDIDDVCWSRMFKPDSGGGDDDGGSKPFDQLTWDQVIASTKTGKYKSFAVGDMKELDLGTEGTVNMQIVGIDADELADGSGKAPLTFISKELLATNHRMNPVNNGNAEGTGTIGGWEKCEMRTYLKDTIKPLVPLNVRNGIKEVTKYSNIFDISGTKVLNSVTTDDVWIPSNREIFGGTTLETLGPYYMDIFTDIENKTRGSSWWLRSAYTNAKYRDVSPSGNYTSATSSAAYGIALGFCL